AALAASGARAQRPADPTEGVCPYAFERVAILDAGYLLQWTLRDATLAVRIVTAGTGWAAIGWPSTSSTTGHTDFDVSFGAVIGGVPSIGDFYQDVFAPPVPDAQNDVTLLGGSEGAGTTLEFTRPFDTGDEAEDNVIVEGPLNLKWAYQPTSDDPTDNHVGFTRGRMVVEIVPPGHLFADGFENESPCAWSLLVP
ncbi:MAG: hypothetical protein F9K16_14085, partial [Thermoanaerobaculia bacterium]